MGEEEERERTHSIPILDAEVVVLDVEVEVGEDELRGA